MKNPRRPDRLLLGLICVLALASVVAAKGAANSGTASASHPSGPSLHEVIAPKYQKRYQEWKSEFLATDIGKAQWEMYASHPRLVLTITIGGKNAEGAGTGGFKRKEKGEAVAGTIVLGGHLQFAYSCAGLYPVN